MTENAQQVRPQVQGALLRYRTIAYVVGVGLLVLVLVGVPLEFIGGDPTVDSIVGPIHGVLYMIYLALTADLALKARWSIKGGVLVALAGTIPFLSFVAERKVTAKVRSGGRL
jgi:integral membrane protein